MRPEKFEIEILDRPVLSYFPGETIRGVVQVNVGLAQQLSFKGLTVTFTGKAMTAWIQSIMFWGSETYFDHKDSLLETETVLPPGSYEYPFQFTLPQELPSSFVGIYGSIRYEVRAEMITDSSFQTNVKTKLPFSVNAIVDLNVPQSLATVEPKECKKYKDFLCLCCKSGPVGFTLKLPKTGFVSGELLKFIVELGNQSRRPVRAANAYLMQEVTYHTTTRSKCEFKYICHASGPPVEPGDHELWTVNSFRVPPLPPTNTTGGSIIKIEYFLKIELHLPGSPVLLKKLPIIIGTVPFRNAFSEISTFQSNVELNSNNPSVAPPAYSPPSAAALNANQLTFFQENYPDLPPPSYQEALLLEGQSSRGATEGRSNLTFEGDDPSNSNSNSIPLTSLEQTHEFTPTYITYRWNAQT